MPRRWVVTAFCFTCLALSYMDRVNLAVATPLLMREFGWNETTMGVLHSLFFYGFLASHVPGGWLADRFGGRRVLGAGTLAWSLATGATPFAGSFAGLGTARLALGLGEGLNTPSIMSLVARWFPVEERSRATVINLAGINSGMVIALPLSAWIAATWGWRAIFWSYAGLGLAWVALWGAWATEPPAAPDRPAAARRVPWRLLLRSRAVWALLLTTFVTNWLAWFSLSWLPTYFVQVHGFSIKESGFVSAIPSLASIAAGLAAGWLADRLIGDGVPVTRVRKGILAAGFTGAIVLLLVLPHTTTRLGAIAALSGALACFALGSSTVLTNSLDLAPEHAGVVVGLQGTIGNLAGTISPVVAGAIIVHTGSWNLNFYVIAALLTAGLILWTSWASGDPVVDRR